MARMRSGEPSNKQVKSARAVEETTFHGSSLFPPEAVDQVGRGSQADFVTHDNAAALAEARLRDTLQSVQWLRRGAQGIRVQLEAGIEAQERRATAAEARLREAEAALAETRRALAEQRVAGAELAAILRATEQRLFRLDEARTGPDPRVVALQESHAVELNRVQRDRVALEQQLAAANRALASEQERILTETARLEADRASLATQVESLERNLAERKREREGLTQTLAQATTRLTELEVQVHEQSLAKTQAMEAATELQARLLEAEAAVLKGREEGGERLAGLERSVTAGREREAALQRTLDQFRQSLEKEKAGSDTARRDLQSHVQMRQALETELVKTRGRALDLQARLQNETQQHAMQLTKLTDRCESAERERDRLRDEVAQLNDANERLERDGKQVRRLLESEQQKNELARLHAKLEEVAWAHPDARRPVETGKGGESPDSTQTGTLAPSAAALSKTVDANMPIVAIGASTGGPAALGDILPLFPEDFAACVLIVQHMPPGYTAELARQLDQRAAITVVEARHGDAIRAGMAFVAPGGHHMEVRGGIIRLSAGPPVNKQRPSADVLFDSLVSLAKKVQVVLLTGMGYDGVAGMARLRAAGAETVVQDQASSVVWGMPGAAIKAGAASLQLPPADLGRYLMRKIAAAVKSADVGETGNPEGAEERAAS